MLQLRDDHIDDYFAVQAAEHGLGRIERSILEVLVNRRAASAQTIILTCIAALTQSTRDITTHSMKLLTVHRRRQRVDIHIAYREIAVVTTLKAEQFRRV